MQNDNRKINKLEPNNNTHILKKFSKCKKFLYKICLFVYYVLIYTFLVFMLANLFYRIPLLGDMATSYSGSLIQIWIVVTAILVIISVYRFIKKVNKTNIINVIISSLSLIICLYILIRLLNVFNSQEIKVSLIKTYFKEDVSKVVTDTIQYKDKEENQLSINLYYENSKFNKPLIIYTHGGGWMVGSENENEYTSKIFAKHGYVVASIGYQLSSKKIHLWDKTEKQILYGIKEVISQLENKSIYMIGDSAGGNLALEISYKINSGIYKSVGGEDLPIVKAVSVNYPVTDLSKFFYNENVMSKKLSKEMAVSYIGGTPQEFPDRYQELTPGNYITEKTPPTSIIVGENDPLVPPYSTYDFAQKLQTKGVVYQLIRVPFFGHAGDMHKNNLFNQAYINSTLDWFGKYKY